MSREAPASVTIVGAKIPVSGRLVEGGVAIKNGKILRIGREASLPKTDRKLRCRGLIALPGLIDAHVHLRDMELSYKEDFLSGTRAAARGGFTTVLDMPNTRPPTDSVERLAEKVERARGRVVVNVGFHAALVEGADELGGMARAGAISFKLYLNRSITDMDVDDDEAVLGAFKTCSSLGVPVCVHAESGPRIAEVSKILEGKGRNSISDFLRAHSPAMEVEAVRRVGRLAAEAGARVHICHVSNPDSVQVLQQLRRRGLRATSEATPHHLFLDDRAYDRAKTLALVVPPLRSAAARKRLWAQFLAGKIDIMASDHAPHALAEKEKDSAWDVTPGFPGLETTLPLLLTRMRRGEIGLRPIIQSLAERPSRIFGLHAKGSLEPGKDADIVLVDPRAKYKIDPKDFLSKAKYSPFEGYVCTGRPVKTLVSGELVADEEHVSDSPHGRILTREA